MRDKRLSNDHITSTAAVIDCIKKFHRKVKNITVVFIQPLFSLILKI